MTKSIPETDLKALRKKLGLTQREFAEKYHLSFQVVRSWEQLEKKPSGAAKLLLFLIDKIPQPIENELDKLS